MAENVEERNALVTQIKDSNPETDVVQKSIGIFGRWHFWVCFAIFLVKFPVAWHQLSIVFVAPKVAISCIDNATAVCAPECPGPVYDRSIFTETIITQWDLICDKAQLANFAQTVTMLGILFGNMLLGILSDKYGRRAPLVGAVIVQVITGTGAALVPWFWLFLILRFLSAAATGGTMVTSFVLIMELVGTKWRTTVGVIYQIPFNLGHLSMAGIAYFLRDWRYFQMAISIPSAILISYYWILPESPRWLLAVGKSEQAVAMMEKAAHHNRLPTGCIKDDVALHNEKKEPTEKQGGNMLDLVRTPNMRCKTICICFNWIVCGLCFFGVAQFIGALGGDIFLNVSFSAAIQIPGTLFSVWAMKHWGRRYTLMSANVLAGVSCLIIGFLPATPEWPRVLLACIGIFGFSVSFPTVYIFSGELFPTVIRNVGVGTSSMCARIGSMLAPFVAGMAAVEPWLPPLIFGFMPLVGAALCYKLPETLDCKLPDTIHEAEEFGKVQKKVAEVDGTAMNERETQSS